MSHDEHQRSAQQMTVRCAVVTVSDTRTEETDRSGSLIRQRLKNGGHEVTFYQIIPDEPALIAELVTGLAGKVDAALFTGGTGISARDQTADVLQDHFDKKLPGFGELFRMLSYEEIGAGAMLSRATAGVHNDTLYFAMPGSLNAVKLAMDELILPELRHLAWEVVKHQEEE